MKRLLWIILLMSVFVSAKAGQYSNTGFADYLFYQGDYYRAIGEYKRYIYSNEKSSNIETAYFMIAKSYLLANKTEQAREAFDYIVQNYEGEYVKKSVIGKILSLSMGEEYEYSNILCKTHSEILDISQSAYLQGINYLSLNDWVGSKIEFEKVQKENELYNSASEMVKYLEGYGGVPQKSEILAGILGAVLPGSGYLYCERYADSLVAFTINAILAYNLYNSINNHDTTGTVLYGISGAVMYTTNITGGITAAGKFNRDKKEEFKKNALELKVDLIKFFLP